LFILLLLAGVFVVACTLLDCPGPAAARWVMGLEPPVQALCIGALRLVGCS
jgi:hypothetical protein